MFCKHKRFSYYMYAQKITTFTSVITEHKNYSTYLSPLFVTTNACSDASIDTNLMLGPDCMPCRSRSVISNPY